jgi:hypothetical protein
VTGAEPMVVVHLDVAEDIIAGLNTLQDRLRHASPDTRDELADFTGRTEHALTMLIDDLGHQALRLRRALAATTPSPDKDTTP